jgi:hypothetical protein
MNRLVKYTQIRRQICMFHTITWCMLHYIVKFADFPAYLCIFTSMLMKAPLYLFQMCMQYIHWRKGAMVGAKDAGKTDKQKADVVFSSKSSEQ